MLKQIPKSDINLRPFKVYKTFTFTENDITASLAYNHTGSNDVLTNDEIFQNGIYHQLYTMYYRDPHNVFTSYGDIAPISESYNTTTSQRYLDTAARVISISQKYYGEGIKPGSIRLDDLQNNKIYTDDNYSNLIDITGSIVGNVFYSHGLIVITNDIMSGSNTGSKYNTFDNYELIYKSTNTIYENEILLVINEDEFNISTNTTSYTETNAISGTINTTYEGAIKYRQSDKYQKSIFADYEYSSSIDTTGSYIAPYITTIGLYDDNMDMVAVAKLAKPVKSMPDLPVNFLIRFDS
jgi:hypothetical protein